MRFALLNVYCTETSGVGQTFHDPSTGSVVEERALTRACFSYFVDKMAHFPLVDRCVTSFLLPFLRCLPLSPACEQPGVHVCGGRGERTLT